MNTPLKQKKAYCFLVSSEGRDFHLLIPFIYYLERFEGFYTTFEFVWDAHKIRKDPPDLVILPNTRGQLLYYEIAAYCYENNILVYAHDSEGNFQTRPDFDFWAYNSDAVVFPPVQFTWNERVKTFLIEKYHMQPEIIKVSGAPNFDRYKYISKPDREKILSRYSLSHFKKVIGYAGWAFGKLYNSEISDILSSLEMDEETGIKWLEDQRDLVEAQLKAAIEAFPDVLFILKKHPRENFESDYRDSRNEMNRLKYPNVLYLKDQESIHDLIGISDLWMAFESTSILEAWLMNKPTLVLNSETEFPRAVHYQGSLISANPEELLYAIRQLYSGNTQYFYPEEPLKKRKMLIEDAIGFEDGLNHLRCAYYFREFLPAESMPHKKVSLNLKFLRLYLLLHIGKLFYIPWLFKRLPKFKKTVWVFENYKLSQVKKEKGDVFRDIDNYYLQQGLPERIRSGTIWNELF